LYAMLIIFGSLVAAFLSVAILMIFLNIAQDTATTARNTTEIANCLESLAQYMEQYRG